MILSNSDDQQWWPVYVTRVPHDDTMSFDWIVYIKSCMAREGFQ